MDNLRWVLLLIGAVIVAVIYLFSRFEVWGKIANLPKLFQLKSHEAPDQLTRREPVAFHDVNETLVEEEQNFDFDIPDIKDEAPTLNAEERLDKDIIISDWAEPEPEPEPEPEVPASTPEVNKDVRDAQQLHGVKVQDDAKAQEVIHVPEESSWHEDAPDTEHIDLDELMSEDVEPEIPEIVEADAPQPKPLPLDIEPLVLVLTVMSGEENRIQGPELVNALEAEGLTYGEMQIFQYLHDNKTPAVFGVVNVIEPGVFDLASMNDMTTPGITLFCQLPGVLASGDAFERMLTCARDLADRLQCRVCDDKRNTITNQALAHYRDQIAAFERKVMLAKRSSGNA